MEERLQKFLARCGVASRRECERLISQGLISVNDIVVTDMGIKIDPDRCIIKYGNKIIKDIGQHIYIMLNKPEGYVTTVKEQFSRPKVTDLLQSVGIRVYPVGRLDYNTSGLLILTNDGEMTYKLTHPSHEVEKTYLALVKGIPDGKDMEQLREGVLIGDFTTNPSKSEIVRINGNNAVLKIIIHEGKNRQVRRMCSAIGHDVIKLKRVSIGMLSMGTLKKGEWRYLTDEEVKYLKNL